MKSSRNSGRGRAGSGSKPQWGGSRQSTHARLMQRLEEEKRQGKRANKGNPVPMEPWWTPQLNSPPPNESGITPSTSTISMPAPETRDSLGDELADIYYYYTLDGRSAVQEAQRKKEKLTRVILWRKGSYVVVEGPFPHGFCRTETRRDIKTAAKLSVDYIGSRPGTESEGHYAKCRKEDIIEVLGGENEFGPVSP